MPRLGRRAAHTERNSQEEQLQVTRPLAKRLGAKQPPDRGESPPDRTFGQYFVMEGLWPGEYPRRVLRK